MQQYTKPEYSLKDRLECEPRILNSKKPRATVRKLKRIVELEAQVQSVSNSKKRYQLAVIFLVLLSMSLAVGLFHPVIKSMVGA